MKEHNQECCPKFEIEKWDKKTFNWENKDVYKRQAETTKNIFFIFLKILGLIL